MTLTREDALRRIEDRGCDSSRFYGEDPPVWDRCLDYEYREDHPTGNPDKDRCEPCLAHAALGEAEPGLDVDRLEVALKAAASIYGWSTAQSREWTEAIAREYASAAPSPRPDPDLAAALEQGFDFLRRHLVTSPWAGGDSEDAWTAARIDEAQEIVRRDLAITLRAALAAKPEEREP